MHQYIKFILYLEWHSACFGMSFRSSSGVQDCTHNQTDTAVCLLYIQPNRYSCLLAVHTTKQIQLSACCTYN